MPAPIPRSTAALAANAAAGCRRSTCRRRRASSCTSSRGWSARGASSRSARSAATRRSGWRGRCRAGGRLVTLEADPRHAEVARANIARRRARRGRVEMRVGPALASLPDLPAEAPFDLVFIDADKPQQPGLSRLGAAADPAGQRHRLRQRGARRPGRRRREPRPRHRRHPAVLRDAGRRAAADRHRGADGRRQGLGRLRHRDRRLGSLPVGRRADPDRSVSRSGRAPPPHSLHRFVRRQIGARLLPLAYDIHTSRLRVGSLGDSLAKRRDEMDLALGRFGDRRLEKGGPTCWRGLWRRARAAGSGCGGSAGTGRGRCASPASCAIRR